ncbi:GNAT family N-acetyltransferase [Denitromonas iodatirespirans]|uniref:GNAT family N-acetyltransferase n=1 Tax=Denitromonas iodatirespirans TaxID=2795389 RepID=A0A944DBV7_DENI1|nr:GNAT family N-acetyltransferase [Denitromonas iodatirespirans]MBT0963425.1 GNAT family N-acetyltransferase [Denitromonas iodatirespirans]
MNVEILDWPAAQPRVMPLRVAVFVVEQGVPAEIEHDAFDARSRHAAITDASGAVIATGRLLPDGHIGRMAVAAAHRGAGLGSRVLLALIDEARRRGLTEVCLNAQTHACAFYRRHGFVEVGAVYQEAGLPHQAMQRRLEVSAP